MTGSKRNMPKPTSCPTRSTQRLGEIEQALDAFEQRPAIYDPADIAIAGVFVSLDADGSLSIDRGYVRPEDERPAEPEATIRRRRTADRPIRPPFSAPSSPSAASPRSRRTTRRTASSRCPSASSSS
jgi:hypothetical protein